MKNKSHIATYLQLIVSHISINMVQSDELTQRPESRVDIHVGPEVICDDVEKVSSKIILNCCQCSSKKVCSGSLLRCINKFFIQTPLALAFGFSLGSFINCNSSTCCCISNATQAAQFASLPTKLFISFSVVALAAGGISAGGQT